LAEWETLIEYPIGYGRAYPAGPDNRMFLMTFYHQLHCIRELYKGISNPDDEEATPHHINHCMQYLRQTLLCGADANIEEGDFLDRDYQINRMGAEVMCWDWEVIFDELDREWNNFVEWRNSSDPALFNKV
jgi:hypothetical protein